METTPDRKTSMIERFKQDIQRWVIPGQVADPALVGFKMGLRLWLRHYQVRLMLLIRLGAWCHRKHVRGMPGLIQRIITLVYGLEIAVSQEIGGGLYVPHPYGMVIMPERIGRNCSIIHNVTIGLRNESKFPTIGDDVFIGSGARLLGGIQIGDGSRIGANAVVIKDVPAGATVVGVPARVIRIEGENTPTTDSDQLTESLIL